MNSLLLLIIGLCVLGMGYRFYAKFLSLVIFRAEGDGSTPAVRRDDARDYMPCNRWVLLSQHGAAAGILSVLGVGLGVMWGWIPAFLWVVVGTLVVGGTYALAALWASLRRSGDSLAGVVFDLAGVWGAIPMFVMGVAVLVFVCAITGVLLGQLLHAHPEAGWSFLGLSLVPFPVRRALQAHTLASVFGWSSVAISFFLLTVLLGQGYPLTLAGVWTLNIGGADLLALPPETTWAVLGLALAYLSVRAPVSEVARPRGSFAGMLLVAMVLLLLIGLGLIRPQLAAPEFQGSADLPGLFPLLFLMVTGGAISGVCALILTGPTMRQIEKQNDAPVLAYGGVIMDGVLAIVVLVVLCAGFANLDDWRFLYGIWPDQPALYVWLDLVINKMAQFVAASGIPLHVAVGGVAAVLAALAVTMLENALRALAYGVEEFVEDFELDRFKGPKARGQISVGVVAVAMLVLLQAEPGLDHWLLFGLASQMFAGTMMLVLGLTVLKHSNNSVFVLCPSVFLLACALWGMGWLLLHWWQTQQWTLVVMAGLTGLLAGLSWVACSSALLAIRRQRDDGIPVARGL